MRVSLCLSVAVVAALGTLPASAQMPDESIRRKLHLPFIISATDCMAEATLRAPGAGAARRNGTLRIFIPKVAQDCAVELRAMIRQHDMLYGGGGREFYEGAYLDDLPRAILKRIGPRLEKLAAEEDAAEAAQRERESAQAAEAKRKQDEAARDAEARARAKREREDIEAKERQAEAFRADQERLRLLDEAKRAQGLLRDRVYECTDQQLRTLVRSGESAEVLANAAMTICSTPVGDALDGAIKVLRLSAGAAVSIVGEDTAREGLRQKLKEGVVASAVQAKAAAAK